MQYSKSYCDLCYLLWNDPDKRKCGEDIIADDAREECPIIEDFQVSALKKDLKITFLGEYGKKWQVSAVKRMKQHFERKYKDTFMMKKYVFSYPLTAPPVEVKNKGGRPRKNIEDLSPRVQTKRHTEILSQFSIDELKRVVLQRERKNSEVEKELQTNAPNADDNGDSPALHQPLAMFHDARLSKRDYNKVRTHTKKISECHVLPCYDKVTEIKKSCYPEEKEMRIQENGASVKIIPLIIHTVCGILAGLTAGSLDKMKNKATTLVGKWGMDGASGQQTTRQRWSSEFNDDGSSNTDQSVFLVTFVPLQLKSGTAVVWQNSTPNSPFFCRPIEFLFQEEDNDVINSTYKKYSSILKRSRLLDFDFEGQNFQMRLDMKCTMIDGKVCNSLANQRSTRSCYLCLVGPADINDIQKVTFLSIQNKELYEHGLSSLHARIKFMEYVLHIAYRLDCDHRVDEYGRTHVLGLSKDECTAIKAANVEKIAERKKKIQQELKSRLQLTVDVVKQGVGTTNCGNVAREFFRNAETVANIIGVNANAIVRFDAILQAITSSQFTINLDEFKVYCLDTAKLFVQLYSWYKMPPSVHKILVHGSDIARVLKNPCGWYSEEAQESLNKFFREARLRHSRMSDQKKANRDILVYLLASSDPKISSLGIKEKSVQSNITEEAKKLLLRK